jgi:hypothetical protein
MCALRRRRNPKARSPAFTFSRTSGAHRLWRQPDLQEMRYGAGSDAEILARRSRPVCKSITPIEEAPNIAFGRSGNLSLDGDEG